MIKFKSHGENFHNLRKLVFRAAQKHFFVTKSLPLQEASSQPWKKVFWTTPLVLLWRWTQELKATHHMTYSTVTWSSCDMASFTCTSHGSHDITSERCAAEQWAGWSLCERQTAWGCGRCPSTAPRPRRRLKKEARSINWNVIEM